MSPYLDGEEKRERPHEPSYLTCKWNTQCFVYLQELKLSLEFTTENGFTNCRLFQPWWALSFQGNIPKPQKASKYSK